MSAACCDEALSENVASFGDVYRVVDTSDGSVNRSVLSTHVRINSYSKVQESILFETSGNTNRFRFKSAKINSGLKDDNFKFTPPPGVEVIQK